MAEFEKILQNHPDYPECNDCSIVKDMISRSRNYHIFTKPNTNNLQIEKGVLRFICHKNIFGELQMTIVKTFPKVGNNGDDKYYIEKPRANVNKICPAINKPKIKPVETDATNK
jgi:hypothetical protein